MRKSELAAIRDRWLSRPDLSTSVARLRAVLREAIEARFDLNATPRFANDSDVRIVRELSVFEFGPYPEHVRERRKDRHSNRLFAISERPDEDALKDPARLAYHRQIEQWFRSSLKQERADALYGIHPAVKSFASSFKRAAEVTWFLVNRFKPTSTVRRGLRAFSIGDLLNFAASGKEIDVAIAGSRTTGSDRMPLLQLKNGGRSMEDIASAVKTLDELARAIPVQPTTESGKNALRVAATRSVKKRRPKSIKPLTKAQERVRRAILANDKAKEIKDIREWLADRKQWLSYVTVRRALDFFKAKHRPGAGFYLLPEQKRALLKLGPMSDA